MAQNFLRACRKTALIVLTAGAVIAATYALTPRFDPQQEEAAELHQAKIPAPASEAALRQAIGEAQSGIPNYDRARKARTQLIANLSAMQRVAVALEGGIPDQTDNDLLAEARRQQRVLANLGPLKSVTYLGGGGRFDRYQVTFGHGPLLWFISLGKNGKLENYGFDTVGIPTPRDYIDNYARFAMRERSIRLATQLAILLIVALFGRLALRLRV